MRNLGIRDFLISTEGGYPGIDPSWIRTNDCIIISPRSLIYSYIMIDSFEK
jgi:hypothetical protein